QEYVEIAGSGRNATMLTGAISTSDRSTSALVKGVNNAGIHSLSIENKGGSSYSIGIYNSDSSPTMSDMSITASGGTNNYAVDNTSSSPKMSDMSIRASGGRGTNGNYGVYNSGSSPTMSDMRITTSGGNSNYGVYTYDSSPTMSDMSITTSGGISNYGVYTYSSSPTMSDMSISASGGANSYGVYNSSDSSYARIQNSTISASGAGGTNNSVVAKDGSESNETYISDSILTGDVTGSPVCSFTFSNSGTDLTDDC
ncbi:MAG: hypothetical protein GY707_09220, partial [Desulfobacteraceae bacterium]|nr:hypothetical protein [Desulfobacteraceae bacterium]